LLRCCCVGYGLVGWIGLLLPRCRYVYPTLRYARFTHVALVAVGYTFTRLVTLLDGLVGWLRLDVPFDFAHARLRCLLLLLLRTVDLRLRLLRCCCGCLRTRVAGCVWLDLLVVVALLFGPRLHLRLRFAFILPRTCSTFTLLFGCLLFCVVVLDCYVTWLLLLHVGCYSCCYIAVTDLVLLLCGLRCCYALVTDYVTVACWITLPLLLYWLRTPLVAPRYTRCRFAVTVTAFTLPHVHAHGCCYVDGYVYLLPRFAVGLLRLFTLDGLDVPGYVALRLRLLRYVYVGYHWFTLRLGRVGCVAVTFVTLVGCYLVGRLDYVTCYVVTLPHTVVADCRFGCGWFDLPTQTLDGLVPHDYTRCCFVGYG